MQKHKNTFRNDDHNHLRLHHHHDAGNDDEEATISSSTGAFQASNSSEDGNKDATGNLSSTIELSPTQIADIIQPYKNNSVIICSFGKRIVRRYLLDVLHSLLTPSEPFHLTELARGFFLLKAPLLSDYTTLLAKYPWSIPNHCLIMLPWVPNFRPSEATITHANVWVRLPELPIEYYALLLQIIPAIGSLVKIDPVTEKQEKCKFARFCVKIDLNSPLVDEIKIGEIRQRVEYEGLEILCSHCKRIGHLQEGCPHNSSSTTNATASKEILVKSTLHRAPEKQILTSRNGNSSSGEAQWVQVRPHKHYQRHAHHHPRMASGAQQSQVQSQNVGTESTPSGSRFQPLENFVEVIDQPNPPEAKSDETSSVTVTAEPNNALIMQNQNPLPGEGASSSQINVEKSVQPNENIRLSLIESLNLEEDPISHMGGQLKQKKACHNTTAPASLNGNQPQTTSLETASPQSSQAPLSMSKSLKPVEDAISYLARHLNLEKACHTTTASLNGNQLQTSSIEIASPQSSPMPLSLTKTLIPEDPTSSLGRQLNLQKTSQTTTVLLHGNQPQTLSLETASSQSSPMPLSLSKPEEYPIGHLGRHLNMRKACHTNTTSLNGNQFQTSSLEIVSPQSSPRAEPNVQFFSKGIQQSVVKEVISNTLEEVSAKTAPTIYSIESRITSFIVGVSRLDTGMEMQDKASFWPITRDSGAICQNISETVSQTQSVLKKLLYWKYNGGGRGKLIQTMKDLKQLHQPSIVLLSGIKISGDDAAQVIEEIGFSGSHCIDPVGFVGGVWLLWHKEDVKIEVHPSTSHKIFAAAHFLPKPSNWMLSGMANPYNQMEYGEDDSNTDPLSLLWGTNYFYTSENQSNYPSSTSQLVSSH